MRRLNVTVDFGSGLAPVRSRAVKTMISNGPMNVCQNTNNSLNELHLKCRL